MLWPGSKVGLTRALRRFARLVETAGCPSRPSLASATPRASARAGGGGCPGVVRYGGAVTDLVIGADGLARCAWGASTPDYVVYHDTEWGGRCTATTRSTSG